MIKGVPSTEWPDGWLAEQRELFVSDMSGNKVLFKFSSAKITTGIPDSPCRNIAQCDMCKEFCEPGRDSLRLHACKHVFLNIPFGAKEL